MLLSNTGAKIAQQYIKCVKVVKQMSFTASIESEADVTIGDIVAEADKIWKATTAIWKKIKLTKGKNGKPTLKPTDVEALDKFFEQQQKRHKQFSTAYPTVMRHQIQDNWYNTDVFRSYLNTVAKKPWTNDKERMDSYTLYATMLMRATAKNHPNATVVKAFSDDYRARLQREHDQFMKDFDLIKAEIEQREKTVVAGRRVDLIAAWPRVASAAGASPEIIAATQTAFAIAEGQPGYVPTSTIESKLYDLKRIACGVSADEIAAEQQAAADAKRERLANATLQIPEQMEKKHADNVRRLAEENS